MTESAPDDQFHLISFYRHEPSQPVPHSVWFGFEMKGGPLCVSDRSQ